MLLNIHSHRRAKGSSELEVNFKLIKIQIKYRSVKNESCHHRGSMPGGVMGGAKDFWVCNLTFSGHFSDMKKRHGIFSSLVLAHGNFCGV